MLATVLLLGILPFAAMPMFQGGDDDGGASGEENETADGEASLLEDPASVQDALEDPTEETAGTTYSLMATPGTTEIPDFEPGQDSMEIDLSNMQGAVYFDMTTDAQASVLSLSVGEESVTTLVFDGLSEVPVGDIFLTMADETTGEPFEISLSDALTEGALDPIDPEALETPGPIVEDPVLDPTDPEDPEDPGPIVQNGDPVLDPLDPDGELLSGESEGALASAMSGDSSNVGGVAQVGAAMTASEIVETTTGDAADTIALVDDGFDDAGRLDLVEGTALLASTGPTDVIDGGAGDEILTFGNGDTASDGSGDDFFWVYAGVLAGSQVADVPDFKVGEDFLRVSLNPQISENGEPDVQVFPSEDGVDGLVIVNGDLVAVLRGAPGATASDVYTEVRLDVFN